MPKDIGAQHLVYVSVYSRMKSSCNVCRVRGGGRRGVNKNNNNNERFPINIHPSSHCVYTSHYRIADRTGIHLRQGQPRCDCKKVVFTSIQQTRLFAFELCQQTTQRCASPSYWFMFGIRPLFALKTVAISLRGEGDCRKA